MTSSRTRQVPRSRGSPPVEANAPASGSVGGTLDLLSDLEAMAAAHLGVTVAFVRRLVLEKRVRYYKVGKFVRLHRLTWTPSWRPAGRIPSRSEST